MVKGLKVNAGNAKVMVSGYGGGVGSEIGASSSSRVTTRLLPNAGCRI